MNIREIAIIGCGRNGAKYVARCAATLPSSMHLRVYVPDQPALKRAQVRISEALETLGKREQAKLELTTQQQAAPSSQLVIVQLPKNGTQIPGVPFHLRSPYPEREALTGYLKDVPKTVPLIKYSAALDTLQEIDRLTGWFHYNNPAHLLNLMEFFPTEATSNEQVEELRTFFSLAGFTPLILKTRVRGFFSNCFQIRLLLAVDQIFKSKPPTEAKQCEAIDKAISLFVRRIRTQFEADPTCADLLTQFQQTASSLLLREPGFEPLWTGFQESWNDLRQHLSDDASIARAFFSGPGLRCINPGFLRTIDLEGLTPFLSLITHAFPDVDCKLIEAMLMAGRLGGPKMLNHLPNGFYLRDPQTDATIIANRDRFLLEEAQRRPAGPPCPTHP